MSSSAGIIIPNIWEKNIPNHQPASNFTLSLSLSPSIAFSSGIELLVYAILTHTHMQREKLTTTFLCGTANDKPIAFGDGWNPTI